MSYQVLARKWRPKKFADLVGQEHVVKAIINAVINNKIHHAYLLTGTRGVGKTTIARILAKSLNCNNTTNGEPCCICDICIQIDNGNYLDLLEIDAASNTGIDNIRDVLENARYLPVVSKYKIYIIDEVHMLSKSAFNAMLKTLEEPPEHVKFILATTDQQKIPITILSRCLQFVLYNLNNLQIVSRLKFILGEEQIEFEESSLQLLANSANGSMRDALSLLDQALAINPEKVLTASVRKMLGVLDRVHLYELLKLISNEEKEELFNLIDDIANKTINYSSVLQELAFILQEIALLQINPKAILKDNDDFEQLQSLAKLLLSEEIQIYYQCVINGKQDLNLAPSEYSGFIMTILRMLSFAPLSSNNLLEDDIVVDSNLNDIGDNDQNKKPVLVKKKA